MCWNPCPECPFAGQPCACSGVACTTPNCADCAEEEDE